MYVFLLLCFAIVVLSIVLFFVTRQTLKKIFQTLYLFFKNSTAVNSIIALIFFPGTFVHEFAHFLMAAMLWLKVKKVHLLPEWDHNSIKLGYVLYEKRDPFRGTIVGIAPIFFGIGMLWILYEVNILQYENIFFTILFFYLAFSISTTMFSSKQDLVDLAYVMPFIFAFIILLFFFRSYTEGILRWIEPIFLQYAKDINEFLITLIILLISVIVIHIIIIVISQLTISIKKKHATRSIQQYHPHDLRKR